MFRQRLLTSLVLVPLVLLAIYYANAWFLVGVVLLLVAIGAWEWTQLIPLNTLLSKLFFIFIVLIFVAINKFWFHEWLLCSFVVWGGILLAVITFPASQAYWGHRIGLFGVGLLLLPLFANTLMELYGHSQGKSLIVYLLCLIWATDIGAYLVGKRWGLHKLIPRVSPGKTIEGATGGFSLAMFVAILGCYYFNPHAITTWYVVSIVTTLISMLGDLLVSMLKRRTKLKDTGHIFPGHGGVLDRLDSLIAATPLFFYGLTFLATSS